MKAKLNNSIVKTLLYSDIFDYPLSEEELWNYLVSEVEVGKEAFSQSVKKINPVVLRRGKYLFIEGKSKNINLRMNKLSESEGKMSIARRASKKLLLVPTVLFIGVSGNLSMMNAGTNDDIDFFIITRKNTLWVTRLLMILILKRMGLHRKKNDKSFSNKICLNMLVDEENIALPEKLRNLYTAHEVAQLMPVMEREGTYGKFIDANKCVSSFMPNIIDEMKGRKVGKAEKRNTDGLVNFFLKLLSVESLAKSLQSVLIRRSITREIIKNGFLAFHPKDYKAEILNKYQNNLVKYGLKD